MSPAVEAWILNYRIIREVPHPMPPPKSEPTHHPRSDVLGKAHPLTPGVLAVLGVGVRGENVQDEPTGPQGRDTGWERQEGASVLQGLMTTPHYDTHNCPL